MADRAHSTRRDFLRALPIATAALVLPAAAKGGDWHASGLTLEQLIADNLAATDEYFHWIDLCEEIEARCKIPAARVHTGNLVGLNADTGEETRKAIFSYSVGELRKVAEQRYELGRLMRHPDNAARQVEWFAAKIKELNLSRRRRNQARSRSGLARAERMRDAADHAQCATGVALMAYRPRTEAEAVQKRQFIKRNALGAQAIDGWTQFLTELVDVLCAV